MGAGVSAGESNDELVDNLKDANYIKTPIVDRVFRAVDRGEYFLRERHVNPYRDVAWKNGHFHISAPCIYSEVLEGLRLQPGFSFLNLGSGTGYLNTVAGLMLGHTGVNHGIELHDDLIVYAHMKLEQFKRNSGAMDEFDFCEPKFMEGNCLNIASGCLLYDRVYCGAACPEQYLNYIKNLIKVGGSLIVPLNDQLVQMDRASETEWNTKALLPVSFASLIIPQGKQEMIKLFDIEPLSLQELCRGNIRNTLRKLVEVENPHIKKTTPPTTNTTTKKKRKEKLSRPPNPNPQFRGSGEELFDYFLLTVSRRKQREGAASAENLRASESSTTAPGSTTTSSPESSTSASESTRASEHDLRSLEGTSERTRGRIRFYSRDLPSRSNSTDPLSGMQEIFVDVLNSFDGGPSAPEPNQATSGSNATDARTETDGNNVTQTTVTIEKMDEDQPNGSEVKMEQTQNDPVHNKRGEDNMAAASCSGESKRKKNSREKLDSGLGDEIISDASAMVSDEIDELSSSSSSEDEEDDDDDSTSHGFRRNSKRSKYVINDTDEREDESSDNEGEPKMKMYKSAYTALMNNKIKALPLPFILKRYLNFFREL